MLLNLGKLGITTFCYNFMAGGGVVSFADEHSGARRRSHQRFFPVGRSPGTAEIFPPKFVGNLCIFHPRRTSRRRKSGGADGTSSRRSAGCRTEGLSAHFHVGRRIPTDAANDAKTTSRC